MSGEIKVREDGVYRDGVKISDLCGPYRFDPKPITIEQSVEGAASSGENELIPYEDTLTIKEDGLYNQHGVMIAPTAKSLDPESKASFSQYWSDRIDELLLASAKGEGEAAVTPEQGGVEDRLNTLEKNFDQIIGLLQRIEGKII